MTTIAEVAVPRDIFKTFDYSIPENMRSDLQSGMRVEVPFRDETLTGFVRAIKTSSDFKGRLSSIRRKIDQFQVLSDAQIELAEWISEYYICPLGLVVPAMIPSSLGRQRRATRNYVQLAVPFEEIIKAINRLRASAPQQAKILSTLLAMSETPLAKELLDEVGSTTSPLRNLEKKGLLKILKRSNPVRIISQFQGEKDLHVLTENQQKVLDQLLPSIGSGHKTHLLHGVNASGKTEVYIRAVQHCLSVNKTAIILVPEISLTPQLIARFRNQFGSQLAVYHSQLTESERNHEWTRMLDGDAKLVIGVRSAIFAPLRDLGLIVIDEEHENTYKQEDPAPRYHARDVAIKRGEIETAVVLLGSATPSLESYQAALKNECQLLELNERIPGSKQPKVELIDVSQEKNLISTRLKDAIQMRLNSSEQVMLILNLRGFSRVALCKRCRQTQRCPSCNLVLTYHFNEQRLVCHLCTRNYPVGQCRLCANEELLFLGFGTEQAEHEIKEIFSHARVARMDSDIVKRGDHDKLLESFRSGEIDILLGTQMIASGLDFPNVTLVGVLSADTTLNVPDFRSGERTFQLVSQAMGRAGRGEQLGEVLIQTHDLESYVLHRAMSGEYREFFKEELELRDMFDFPPSKKLIKLTIQARNEESAASSAEQFVEALRSESFEDTEILDASKAQPYRLRGEFRWRVVIKYGATWGVKAAIQNALIQLKSSVQIKVDVDPGNLWA